MDKWRAGCSYEMVMSSTRSPHIGKSATLGLIADSTPRKLPFQDHPDASRVKEIYHSLALEGHQLLIVGGAVRDWILGVQPKDLDLVTTATPDELEKIFPKTIPVGKAFGVMLVVQGEKPFEVATLRTEGRYLDGRHPEKVAWGTIDQDVHRRDFTINSIYYDPFRQSLYDLAGGLADLDAKILRTVGDARVRFEEDHLRVLRAYRFRAQTGFSFAPGLREVLKESVPLLRDVSGERRREELTRLFDAPFCSLVVQDLVADGVLAAIMSSSEKARVGAPTSLLDQLDWRTEAYRPWRAKKNVRLLALLRWIWRIRPEGADVNVIAREFADRLRLSREEKKSLDEALIFWREPAWLESASAVEILKRLWSPDFLAGLEQYETEMIDANDSRGWIERVYEARDLKRRWGARPPEAWLKAADFPNMQGQELGQALKRAYDEQLMSFASNREEFLKWRKMKV